MIKYVIVLFLAIAHKSAISEEVLFSQYTRLLLENDVTNVVTIENEKVVCESHLCTVVNRCDNNEYYCIDSREFQLSLPKKGFKLGDAWKYQGISYESRDSSVIAFSKLIYVDLIVSDKANFYFTKEYGLLAYIVKGGEEQRMMLLSNLTGVGLNWYKQSVEVNDSDDISNECDDKSQAG